MLAASKLRAPRYSSACSSPATSRYPRSSGSRKAAGALSVGRYAASAVRLADGRVLVAGGYSFETNRTHSSSEVFDPAAGSWADGPRLTLDRNFPGLATLPNGEWLFIDG